MALIAGLAVAGALAVVAARADGTAAGREVAWLSQLAENGDTGAELQLGLAYRDGRYGLDPDPRTGLKWLTLAGRGGNAYAADAAANAYATGQGTPRDPQQALYWWRRAARGGNADAQAHLGEALLARGQDAQAVSWLRDAADRGDSRAHADLARLYREQLASDADLHRGENPVAALGDRLDSPSLMFAAGIWNTLEVDSPLAQSTDALLARARDGDPVAEYQLAIRYRDGAWAVPRDPGLSRLWLRRSAAAGNPVARETLARTRSGE